MPIKYLGSKRQFVPLITDMVERLRLACTVLDLFSGTARVGAGFGIGSVAQGP